MVSNNLVPSSYTPPLLCEESLQLSVLSKDLPTDLMALGQPTAVPAQVGLPLPVGVLHEEVPSDDREAEVAEHGDAVGGRGERHAEGVDSLLEPLMSLGHVLEETHEWTATRREIEGLSPALAAIA